MWSPILEPMKSILLGQVLEIGSRNSQYYSDNTGDNEADNTSISNMNPRKCTSSAL